jgi:calcineurin-like phosphoesterase family protein
MNKTLINNWNSKVTKEDVVFHLGDFCFGPYKEFERKLNGKIVYIKGNHDQNIFADLEQSKKDIHFDGFEIL